MIINYALYFLGIFVMYSAFGILIFLCTNVTNISIKVKNKISKVKKATEQRKTNTRHEAINCCRALFFIFSIITCEYLFLDGKSGIMNLIIALFSMILYQQIKKLVSNLIPQKQS